MRIGVLETGEVDAKLKPVHGSYGDMFASLISGLYDAPNFNIINILKGQFPKNPMDCDLWVISGSRHGVYDDLSWIDPLKNFILRCIGRNIPLFGVCFGHQILAEAMGGSVKKFEHGWCLGVHEYKVKRKLDWNNVIGSSFSSFAIHQDQVVVPPLDSTNIAGSKFCKFALLAYGNLNHPYAISLQSHPELTHRYVSDLIKVRKSENSFPPSVANDALETLRKEVDNKLITQTILTALNP